jgi:hypothetical protein
MSPRRLLPARPGAPSTRPTAPSRRCPRRREGGASSAVAPFGARLAIGRRILPILTLAVVAIAGTGALPTPAVASSSWWSLASSSRPSNLEVESKATIVVTAANLGDGTADGKISPVSITDVLPPNLKPLSVEGIAGEPEGLTHNRGPVQCPKGSLTQTITCTFSGTLPPFDQIELLIEVEVGAETSSSEANEVLISGAGAPSKTLRRAITVGGEESFGIEGYTLVPEEEGGGLDTQAGSHPFQVTGSFTVKQTGKADPVVLPKELNGKLPPGLIGNPTPLAQCTLGQFLTIVTERTLLETQCPADSVVGVAMVTINERTNLGVTTFTVPIFNVEPSRGEPARFALYVPGTPVFLDPSLRTGGDYGITLGSKNISQTAALLSFKLTFWGVPGDPRHDSTRGIGCIEEVRGGSALQPCTPLEAKSPPPFISLPTSCSEELQTSIEGASWKQPSKKLSFPGAPMGFLDGCNRLSFDPSIRATPDGANASTPTGLNVDVHVPQDAVLVANGLAESNVKDITVTLPEGMQVNPAGADGLQACSEGQIGFLENGSLGTSQFTPTIGEPFCPDAAKIGTVTLHTPLLPNPLSGAVYLATQNQNPFGSLIALYIVAEDPTSGSLVKLPGEVSLSPSGQITTTFKNNPQVAFEDAELHFFGGERAPLATPAHCGTYTVNATFTPWSANQPVNSSSSFNLTQGPNGSPCPGAGLPFNASITGGSENIQAGAYTPFTTTLNRPDGNQDLKAVTLRMPPGLSGVLTGVALCGEAEANAGSCKEESLIGETIVSVGVGSDPFSVKGGKVYITGPYKGAPFGLSIVNPAVAGPFDLGKVIVRAKLEVDPHTAALTVTTDPEGPYSIPTVLDGIPLQIKHVAVTITRPNFTFNPTNCSPQAISSTLASAQGAAAQSAIPFQVTNCATLAFAPKFAVSTKAKTTKANGAALNVKLAYPTGPKAPFGSQANIAYVKVELPKALPSRLTTLQKACTAQAFDQNPASCPAASVIGKARATTPLLPVPLEGPAYFVSHGNEAFPSLVIVLQGYGVSVELIGTTLIKKGITSTTFKTIPDVPVGNFELNLPQGPFSALAANTNLCATTTVTHKRIEGKRRTIKRATPVALTMPTEFKAQNGAVFKQSTKIAVSGCAKVKVKGKKGKKGKKK